MPYQLTANIEKAYVHLVYHGTVELDERLCARADTFALCDKHNLYHSLVDLSQSDMQISERDAIRFAQSFKTIERPQNYRLACIIRPEQTSDNLIETIITHEGINVKYFYEEEEALRWLLAV